MDLPNIDCIRYSIWMIGSNAPPPPGSHQGNDSCMIGVFGLALNSAFKLKDSTNPIA